MSIASKKIEYLKSKEHFDFYDLCALVEALRSEEGCPWDREQTNKSIRNAFIDETYEFIEGLDNDDNALMCEELGDVIFQIVFHACIKQETDEFNISDVIDGICKKMILRHPHVFGDVSVSGSGEVLDNWEKIKNVEKQRKTPYERLASISKALPSLMRSAKLQAKSEKYGLCEEQKTEDYTQKIADCLALLNSGKGDKSTVSELLFASAGAARTLGFEPEEILYEQNELFLKNFQE